MLPPAQGELHGPGVAALRGAAGTGLQGTAASAPRQRCSPGSPVPSAGLGLSPATPERLPDPLRARPGPLSARPGEQLPRGGRPGFERAAPTPRGALPAWGARATGPAPGLPRTVAKRQARRSRGRPQGRRAPGSAMARTRPPPPQRPAAGTGLGSAPDGRRWPRPAGEP